ncbi:TetR/AcrR family transcriptional regulator [Nonomuraea sp. NN258]|uniref:TetR/AcrR family transcriptional regulator n=1 Tax=Nonomuraea antri TaxID=2730852 RepID=UPI001569C7DB|nr:TetR/AcrR family transcriptional regulator [Nonomuraea antri]NRQ38704.1 TetR/AcrR family transcriptional regulator [Nonomuraea antri]
MPSDTKARIQAVARELFAEQGVQNTSLRQISERLGITKPALYYHFSSREDLVRSILQPMMEDVERFVATREPGDPHELLDDYFDLLWRHREVIVMVLRELSVLAYVDLGERMLDWRRRLITLLLGEDLTPAHHIRATLALGGLSDCAVEYAHLRLDEVKPVAVTAAVAVLQLD